MFARLHKKLVNRTICSHLKMRNFFVLLLSSVLSQKLHYDLGVNFEEEEIVFAEEELNVNVLSPFTVELPKNQSYHQIVLDFHEVRSVFLD